MLDYQNRNFTLTMLTVYFVDPVKYPSGLVCCFELDVCLRKSTHGVYRFCASITSTISNAHCKDEDLGPLLKSYFRNHEPYLVGGCISNYDNAKKTATLSVSTFANVETDKVAVRKMYLLE